MGLHARRDQHGGRAELHSDDIEVWWEIWRRMTSRYAFRGGRSGPEIARVMLEHLGGATSTVTASWPINSASTRST